MQTTLSTFFPKGTEYFYSYPAGEDSGFFNAVDPEIEELVAARLMVCAGPHVKVAVFAASQADQNSQALLRELDTPFAGDDQAIVLPAEISSEVLGAERNRMIKQALKSHITPGKLVMAQPFLDEDLKDYYLIDPKLTIWLNDKKHMADYIPSQFLARRYCLYESGSEFANDESPLPIPCVVKVSSSSSGDGVRICYDPVDLEYAKSAFSHAKGAVVVEQYIAAAKNFGIQFAIPYDTEMPAQIIGFNQQIISETGEFMGGMIDESHNHPELTGIYKIVLDQILPIIRSKGWFGVGGFDALVTDCGDLHFIDCNFRTTGMTPYIFLAHNGLIAHSLVSFAASFHGSEKQFRKAILPFTEGVRNEQILTIISLIQKDGSYRINGCVQFDTADALRSRAAALTKAGLESSVLRRFATPPQQQAEIPIGELVLEPA